LQVHWLTPKSRFKKRSFQEASSSDVAKSIESPRLSKRQKLGDVTNRGKEPTQQQKKNRRA